MTDNLLEQGEDLPQDIDPNKNYLVELVGEGKKFKSPEDLAKGKYEADQYVEILKRRLDTLTEDYKTVREENVTRAKLEDVVKQMIEQKQLTSSADTQANEEHQKPTIDPKDIESLVSNKIQEIRTSERQQENFNLVRDKLQQRYGKNYKEAVQQQITELGITETELNEMARRTPKLLMKSLGLLDKPSDPFSAPPRSQSTQTSFTPSGPTKRTWSYYQELRKKDPNAWLDRKTAVQMQKDAIELGDEFMDGDYFLPGVHER